jgi:hypothetical protein
VRRPVAVSIVTFILALAGKLMMKDRLTREAASGFARRGEYMGLSLVGRTLGSIGIGNIGTELFRLTKPFDMRLIAHDPYADKTLAAELGVELVGLEEAFRRSDFVSVSCPLTPQTRHLVNAKRLALMKPTAYLINTARGPIVDQNALTRRSRNGGSPARDSMSWRKNHLTPTIRSSSSTMSSWHPTPSAGRTSALPVTGPPMSAPFSMSATAARRASLSTATCSKRPLGEIACSISGSALRRRPRKGTCSGCCRACSCRPGHNRSMKFSGFARHAVIIEPASAQNVY